MPDPTDAASGATIECPVCGNADSHGHTPQEVEQWINARLFSWGMRAFVGMLNGPDPRHEKVKALLDCLRKERDRWESTPRGFSTVSFYEAPMLRSAVEAIEILASMLHEREAKS